MTLTPDDLEIMAFDPPHLGMPGRPSYCGRAENSCGFVEIFVTVEGDRIIDVGFLTSIVDLGMVCASACCGLLLDQAVSDMTGLCDEDVLRLFPPAMRQQSDLLSLSELCVNAARSALTAAFPCPCEPAATTRPLTGNC